MTDLLCLSRFIWKVYYYLSNSPCQIASTFCNQVIPLPSFWDLHRLVLHFSLLKVLSSLWMILELIFYTGCSLQHWITKQFFKKLRKKIDLCQCTRQIKILFFITSYSLMPYQQPTSQYASETTLHWRLEIVWCQNIHPFWFGRIHFPAPKLALLFSVSQSVVLIWNPYCLNVTFMWVEPRSLVILISKTVICPLQLTFWCPLCHKFYES